MGEHGLPRATLVRLAKGSLLHRVHPAGFAGDAFNSNRLGNARFSPLSDPAGEVIPTIYAGSTLNCVLMETIFHDVPYAPGFKPVSRDRLAGSRHSILKTKTSLSLIDLRSIALRKLGVERSRLIDTPKSQYPDARAWALVLYSRYPKAQGLQWTSRQDDSAVAYVLWGTRIPSGTLAAQAPALRLDEGAAWLAVLNLADRIGALLVDPRQS